MYSGNKFVDLFKSRKFWAAVIGLVLMFVKSSDPGFPVNEDQIIEPLMQVIGVVVIVVGYIMGTAVEDAGK